MKQTRDSLMLKRRIVYTIVFLQFFLLNSFAVGSLVKEECILIINANSDLSPLSNHIISEPQIRNYAPNMIQKRK